ncbi:MAG: hypothetical protein RSB39_05975 [Oscillospiraceae bacterium]
MIGIKVGNGVNLKPTIIAALTDMDVPLAGTENTDELVEKIRDIIVGDLTVALFDATIIPTVFASAIAPTSYVETGETLSLAGLTTVSRCNLITEICAVFDGVGADNVEPVSGCGWIKTNEAIANQSVLKYVCPDRVTKFVALEALNKLKFTATDSGTVTMTIKASALGVSAIVALGAATARFSAGNSWIIVENKYPSFGAMSGKTWTQIEALRKADYVP